MFHLHHYIPPAMQRVLMAVYMVAYIFFGFQMFNLAKDSASNWLPTVGAVSKNTSEKRTIVYEVNKKRFETSNESLLDVLAKQYNYDFHFRPGQQRVIYDGIDPEVGRQVTVYYNPKSPSVAVVQPGWSATVVIFAICTAIPLFLLGFLSLVGGWDLNEGYSCRRF